MSAKNMYETVLSTTDGYSLMSNGFYVPTESISKTSEIKYLTVLQSLSWNLTPKRTEFIVPCSQNVSFTMWMGTDQAELTLYNLYSTNIKPALSAGQSAVLVRHDRKDRRLDGQNML